MFFNRVNGKCQSLYAITGACDPFFRKERSMILVKRSVFCWLLLAFLVSGVFAQSPSKAKGFPLQLTIKLSQSDHDQKKEKTSFGVYFYDPGKWHDLGEEKHDVSNYKELLDLLKIKHGFRDLRGKMAGLYPRFGDELVAELAGLAGNSQADKSQRKKALLVLATIGPDAKSAVPSVVRLLSGSFSLEAKGVLAAIGRSAVSALVSSLGDLDREQSRLAAAQALALIGPAAREAYPVLSEVAKSDWNPKVRSAALEALVKLKAHREKTDEALVHASKDDEPEVRSQALKLLKGRYRTEQNIAVAVKALKDPDASVRKAAVELVQKYGGSADKAILKLGLMLSEDPDPGVRQAAIRALSAKKQKAAVVIKNLCIAVGDVELRGQIASEAIRLLGRLDPNGSPVVNVVVVALRHPSSNVRAGAARFLAKYLEVPGVRAALEAAQSDDEKLVRDAVKKALEDRKVKDDKTSPSGIPRRRTREQPYRR